MRVLRPAEGGLGLVELALRELRHSEPRANPPRSAAVRLRSSRSTPSAFACLPCLTSSCAKIRPRARSSGFSVQCFSSPTQQILEADGDGSPLLVLDLDRAGPLKPRELPKLPLASGATGAVDDPAAR